MGLGSEVAVEGTLADFVEGVFSRELPELLRGFGCWLADSDVTVVLGGCWGCLPAGAFEVPTGRLELASVLSRFRAVRSGTPWASKFSGCSIC